MVHICVTEGRKYGWMKGRKERKKDRHPYHYIPHYKVGYNKAKEIISFTFNIIPVLRHWIASFLTLRYVHFTYNASKWCKFSTYFGVLIIGKMRLAYNHRKHSKFFINDLGPFKNPQICFSFFFSLKLQNRTTRVMLYW